MKNIRCLILAVSLGAFLWGIAYAEENTLKLKYRQYTIPTSAGSFIPVSKAGVVIASIFSQLKAGYTRPQPITSQNSGNSPVPESVAPAPTPTPNPEPAPAPEPPTTKETLPIGQWVKVLTGFTTSYPVPGEIIVEGFLEGRDESGRYILKTGQTVEGAPITIAVFGIIIRDNIVTKPAPTPTPTPEPGPAGFQLGDLSGDGTINSADLLAIKQYLAGNRQLTPEQLLAADFDKDGTVSAYDSRVLAAYIVGKINTLYNVPQLGDLTGDGKIDSADLLAIKQYLAGNRQLTPERLLAADIDGDGQLTAADATNLGNYIVGNVASLPIAEVTLSNGLMSHSVKMDETKITTSTTGISLHTPVGGYTLDRATGNISFIPYPYYTEDKRKTLTPLAGSKEYNDALQGMIYTIDGALTIRTAPDQPPLANPAQREFLEKIRIELIGKQIQ